MGYRNQYSKVGVKQYWGNGDGRFVYPPWAARVPGASGPGPVIEPPVSSIRWEMLREGIEDYEMLYLLRQRLNAARDTLAADEVNRIESLLAVPESITSSEKVFTADPAPIHARREMVAKAIERLVE